MALSCSLSSGSSRPLLGGAAISLCAGSSAAPGHGFRLERQAARHGRRGLPLRKLPGAETGRDIYRRFTNSMDGNHRRTAIISSSPHRLRSQSLEDRGTDVGRCRSSDPVREGRARQARAQSELHAQRRGRSRFDFTVARSTVRSPGHEIFPLVLPVPPRAARKPDHRLQHGRESGSTMSRWTRRRSSASGGGDVRLDLAASGLGQRSDSLVFQADATEQSHAYDRPPVSTT